MITALFTLWPKYASAASFSLRSVKAEISGGVYSLVADLDLHVVFRPADHLVGHDLLFGGHFVVPPAHESLDRIDRAERVGDRLPPGRLAHDGLALVGERDDAGRQPVALGVGNDLGLFAFHHGHDRVRGAQVDSDDFFALSHDCLLLSSSALGRVLAPAILNSRCNAKAMPVTIALPSDGTNSLRYNTLRRSRESPTSGC